MSKNATFQDLIDMCEKVGWGKGIRQLESIVFKHESIQADLFAGTPSQVKQARRLSKKIIQQNLTISRLKEYRKNNINE